MDNPCWLALEDGSLWQGVSFGAKRDSKGEIVFNTGMCGYVESLTDPSYKGQILMMTYPLIGNYGVTESDSWKESSRIQVEGYVVRELTYGCEHPKGTMQLDEFLQKGGVPGCQGVDTRELTKLIRTHGTMRCVLAHSDPEVALKEARTMDFPDKRNLVAEVSTKSVVEHPGGKLKVVLLDCGVKLSIIRNLQRFATVVQVPYNTPADDILKLRPDGVLVSNGPGDPAHPEIMSTTVKTIRSLVSELPVFGICLGNQIIALSLGAKTFKLKFGHRGVNHPVIDVRDRGVRITSQNHGFAVAEDLPSELIVTERNLNDDTIEGLRHAELNVASVQYHPEANPGPHDPLPLFKRFEEMMKGAKAR